MILLSMCAPCAVGKPGLSFLPLEAKSSGRGSFSPAKFVILQFSIHPNETWDFNCWWLIHLGELVRPWSADCSTAPNSEKRDSSWSCRLRSTIHQSDHLAKKIAIGPLLLAS